MSDLPVIQAVGLTRYFNGRCAVQDLHLSVPRGGVFGFLGRNGSGKTTTIRLLLGLLRPDRGSSTLLGCDSRHLTPEIRGRVGYVTEEHCVVQGLTVTENGAFQSRFFPRWNPRVFDSVAGHFGLKGTTRARDLSRGERAGLALAMALAPEPELLILDDPALGLDPVARRALVESMIYITRRSDRTIFFSSHDLADVERVADSIAILDHSVLRACCPLDVFQSRVKRYRLRFKGGPPSLPKLPGVLQVRRGDQEMQVTGVSEGDELRIALNALGAESLEQVPMGMGDSVLSFLGERGEKAMLLVNNEEES